MRLLPVVLSIDVEPDALFLGSDDPLTWDGFEAAVNALDGFRSAAPSPRFSWKLRMDPQIEAFTGSQAHLVETQREVLDSLMRSGDEIGVHLHPFRWHPETQRWVVDYADADWVAACVSGGLAAFQEAVGAVAPSASMGHNWQSLDTLRQFASRGVLVDLSVEHGTTKPPFTDGPTAFLGPRPSYEAVPAIPYRPSDSDFRNPDPTGSPALPWIVPLASLPFGSGREKVRLDRGPVDVDRIAADHPAGVAISVRSDSFADPGRAASVLANLRVLADRGDTAFVTPLEAVQLVVPF